MRAYTDDREHQLLSLISLLQPFGVQRSCAMLHKAYEIDWSPYVPPKLSPDEIVVRVGYLERLQERTYRFGWALHIILDAPVSFNNTRSELYETGKKRFFHGGLSLKNFFVMMTMTN